MILSRGKLIFAIILSFILILQPVAVLATPSLQDQRAKEKRLKAEINELDQRSEIAVERYNQARLKLSQIQDRLVTTRANLDKAKEDLARSQKILNRRAALIYKAGEIVDALELLLAADSIAELISAAESLEYISNNDAKIVKRIKKHKATVERMSKTLTQQETKQASLTSYVRQQKDNIVGQLSERKRALSKVKDEIERAESAASQARLASIGRARAVPAPKIVNVPPSGKGGSVVSLAMAELGKPYVWGAEGPNSFDCSGLTKYVFAKVGVSLPHSAQAQFHMGQRVSRENLQPGDLIFGGSSGYVSHVGIYIGGGNYVHAPRTGDVVKVSSLASRSNYVGAVRI